MATGGFTFGPSAPTAAASGAPAPAFGQNHAAASTTTTDSNKNSIFGAQTTLESTGYPTNTPIFGGTTPTTTLSPSPRKSKKTISNPLLSRSTSASSPAAFPSFSFTNSKTTTASALDPPKPSFTFGSSTERHVSWKNPPPQPDTAAGLSRKPPPPTASLSLGTHAATPQLFPEGLSLIHI